MRGGWFYLGLVLYLVYMKSGIEKVTKSIQSIRRFRFLYLFILFAIGVFIFNIAYLDRFHINVDSARYLLSALVQSQAAIVAIVVTLTLIAVQLAASSYSPRVIDIFKNDPTMLDLLFGYGMSIFFGLFVLEMIQDEDPSQTIFWSFHNIYINISISLEWLIYLAYWFGLVAFAALSVYMITIIDLLKPENIIKRLSENISKENVLKFIESEEKQKEDRTKKIEEDPIQPIMDIIHGAVMKYDIATTRIGLDAVTDRVIEIIDSDSQEEISTCFCDHLERVSTLTVNKMDEESTAEAIKNLDNFGKSTAERGFESAASGAARSLGFVGKIAAERGFERETNQAARSLENIGETAAEKKLAVATFQAVLYLGIIEADAAERGLERTTKQAAHSIGHVGKAAAENGLEVETLQTVEFLRTIGLESAVSEAAWSLVYVGIAAAKKGLESATKQAAQFLAELAISSEGDVKTAIENHRLALRGKDQKFFDSFMNLYEHELEELRTRNSN
jgi:hypothetical protein